MRMKKKKRKRRIKRQILYVILIGLLMFVAGYLLGGLLKNEKIFIYEIRPISNEIKSEPMSIMNVHKGAMRIRQLKMFTLTAYCSCEKCCGDWANNRPVDSDGKEIVVGATGQRLKEGVSIAVDPRVIPYGTIVEFLNKKYVAQDCGGAIKGNRIDVYFMSHDQALEFGVQKEPVFFETTVFAFSAFDNCELM